MTKRERKFSPNSKKRVEGFESFEDAKKDVTSQMESKSVRTRPRKVLHMT
jgi:hypothetical protein